MQYVEGLTSRLRKIDSDIERLRGEIDRLQIKRDLLKELIAEAPREDDHPTMRPVLPPDNLFNGHAVGATEAILTFLRAYPGSKGKDVVDHILPHVEMDAQDPRRNLFSIMSTLRRRGRLHKGPDGGFYVQEAR